MVVFLVVWEEIQTERCAVGLRRSVVYDMPERGDGRQRAAGDLVDDELTDCVPFLEIGITRVGCVQFVRLGRWGIAEKLLQTRRWSSRGIRNRIDRATSVICFLVLGEERELNTLC